MTLWLEWFRCVQQLRPACTRLRTFLWMVLALVGFSIRPERAGVTSFVRALWLRGDCYHRLLYLFHSPALILDRLTGLWIALVLKTFAPVLENGRPVYLADGLKIPKEGRKMPAVKKLHQDSADNSKAEFIFGHSFQVLALLVHGPLGHLLSVPLASRIHEGVQLAPSPKSRRRSLLDKMVELFLPIAELASLPSYLLADAYYASQKVIHPLLEHGHHLITRVRRTCVAYHPAPHPSKRKRGRPRIYGEKVPLRSLWSQPNHFESAPSPLYGEQGVRIRYRSIDLLWRPVGRLVRFVFVEHPTRGRAILLCTDIHLDPLRVVALYGHRFKIEVSFKQALHTIGSYAYHFWMKEMRPLSRKRSGDQFLHTHTERYRRMVHRKIAAYHRFVQLACVAQGLQQYLALQFRSKVWRHFCSWMRTMNPHKPPSEAVVSQSLRNTLLDFLLNTPQEDTFAKFLLNHIDINRCPDLTLVA